MSEHYAAEALMDSDRPGGRANVRGYLARHGAMALAPELGSDLQECPGWVSTTIARYLYPTPKRWGSNEWQGSSG